MATAPDQLLGLSDEDFGKINIPDTDTTTTDTTTGADGGAEAGAVADPAPVTDPAPVVEEPKVEPIVEAPAGEPAKVDEPAPGDKPADKDGVVTPPGSTEGTTPAQPAATDAGAASSVVELTPEQKVSGYEAIMKPFKANGKMVELRSPEEAIALMQMGANYTKRMQDIQPHRKVLMMLQNNGLLDEGKLSFLIDIDRRDPEAIKKLLKDGGLDPLEIDVSGDPAYVEGSHRIGDDEVKFRTTLDELGSNPAGAETLTEINTGWDQASKQVLWSSPEIMTVIHQQREMGVYEVIKAEVDRRITLGAIPPNTPFLQAYKTVGDEMANAAIAGSPGGEPSGATTAPGGSTTQPTVVATRTEVPKSQLANGDRASAASPTRITPTATTGDKSNPLAMADDEFLKSMNGRV